MNDIALLTPGSGNIDTAVDVTPDYKQPESLPEITEAEAMEAVREAGMSIVNFHRVRKFAILGRYLRQCGLLDVARGKMASRLEALERARDVMLKITEGDVPVLDKNGVEMDGTSARIAAAQALNLIARTENDSVELNLKMERMLAAPPKPSHSNKAPPPGFNVAIQVNK